MNETRYIRWFSQLSIDDVPLVGGKNASLGEMYRELAPQGIKVPNGFAITAEAYRGVLTQAGAWDALQAALAGLDPNDMDDPARRGAKARAIVYGAPLPQALQAEIIQAYHQLHAEYGEDMSVAVRSSATAEDLPTASLPASKRPISISAVTSTCWMPCAAVSPPCSPTAPSITASTTASITSRWRCPSAS